MIYRSGQWEEGGSNDDDAPICWRPRASPVARVSSPWRRRCRAPTRPRPAAAASRIFGNTSSYNKASCSPLFLSGNKLRTYQHFHGLVLFDSIIYFLAVKLDMSEYRKRVEETKEDLLHLYLQMHSNDSRTVGAENMKAERLQLVRQFRAKTLKARQVTVRLDSGAPR